MAKYARCEARWRAVRLWVRMDAQWDTQRQGLSRCARGVCAHTQTSMCGCAELVTCPAQAILFFNSWPSRLRSRVKAVLKMQAPTRMSTCHCHVRTYVSELFCTFLTCGMYVVRVVHIGFVCVQATPPRVGAFQRVASAMVLLLSVQAWACKPLHLGAVCASNAMSVPSR